MRLMAIIATALLLPLFSLSAVAHENTGITVSQAWSRATPGGAKNGAAFMQITAAHEGDKLVDAESDAAERVELHNHVDENGVMKMRRVDSIEVPAGQTVTLAPGGYHVMFMNIKQPLKAGDELDLTLVFEKAGEVEVTATVEPIGARGPGAAAGEDHHDHDHDHDHGHSHHHNEAEHKH